MARRVSPALPMFVLAAVLVTGAAAVASDGRGHEITIRSSALEPSTLRVALHERVVFVNRSGRGVHVEFVGASGDHHVFQVPGIIWAEFHRPGAHPYVVHFWSRDARDLEGVVDVEYGPPFLSGPECGGFTVEEVCIER